MTGIQGVNTTVRPSGAGCAECLASDDGWWLHLRRCAECGHVGCCDSSPAQHASRHYRETGHRYMQSYEPGEEWFWDFENQEAVRGVVLAGPTSRPESQPSPAPADRVPEDWQQHLN
ncbi:UBP-type zinc finger domain-containing protein [Nocardioides sp. YR527]|uniref:UBP-type zinc finger domain-containing protein n=1 Tax=Nocardioides sp. YR527 TaxID=1881028 RepID=UPI000B896F9B|nr:UBP-type zinc finger domain-containing protein [Nocardioides sp. YR527]